MAIAEIDRLVDEVNQELAAVDAATVAVLQRVFQGGKQPAKRQIAEALAKLRLPTLLLEYGSRALGIRAKLEQHAGKLRPLEEIVHEEEQLAAEVKSLREQLQQKEARLGALPFERGDVIATKQQLADLAGRWPLVFGTADQATAAIRRATLRDGRVMWQQLVPNEAELR